MGRREFSHRPRGVDPCGPRCRRVSDLDTRRSIRTRGRRRSEPAAVGAVLAVAVLGGSGCAITQRIDAHTFEIHGNAAKVDEVAQRTCAPGQLAGVTQLEYKPARTGSSVIDISRSSTSCDSYGSCTR